MEGTLQKNHDLALGRPQLMVCQISGLSGSHLEKVTSRSTVGRHRDTDTAANPVTNAMQRVQPCVGVLLRMTDRRSYWK